jgi:hypothetical protein
MTGKPKREGPLKVPIPFDEAIRRALKVKPPQGGWKTFERAKARANRRDAKPSPPQEGDPTEEGSEG